MNDAVPEPDSDRLVWMYRQMLRIREFEERVKATFTEHPGVIRGHTHLADGAEASIVGSLAALRRSPGPGDQVMTTCWRTTPTTWSPGWSRRTPTPPWANRCRSRPGRSRCPASRSTAGTRFSCTARWDRRWPGPAQVPARR